MGFTKVSLQTLKGDYLHRLDTERGVVLGGDGVGSEWELESTDTEDVYRIKSFKGDYLHRPDTDAGVTTWGTGVGNEWTIDFPDNNTADVKRVTLKSWKGDYLYHSDDAGVTTSQEMKKACVWKLTDLSA